MAQESGRVNSSREALVEVRLISGEVLECVVDTGFDGGLMLPHDFVDHLQIPIIGRLAFETVGGTRLFARVGLANIDWLDEVRQIEIVVSDGDEILTGTELLQEAMLMIDYVSGRVEVSKASE